MNNITYPQIGIDESGKGDFFGPLVICAVIIESHEIQRKLTQIGVKDSKLITNSSSIKDMSTKIKKIICTQNSKMFDIVCINPPEYNRLYTKIKNLNTMLAWGHRRSLYNVLNMLQDNQINCTVISDRFSTRGIITSNLNKKFPNLTLIQKTHAESLFISVAAASIIARDYFLKQLELLKKITNIELTKGSGTQTLNLATKLIEKLGIENMNLISKMHFKTLTNAKKISDNIN